MEHRFVFCAVLYLRIGLLRFLWAAPTTAGRYCNVIVTTSVN